MPENIRTLGYCKIDFYLPEHNIFIEYNGMQHYIPIKYYGGQIKFELLQKRDEFVRTYCKTNNIKLLEIPYTLKFSLVLDLLNETITKNNN